ncbi:hypothetical protein EV361DRAFT_1035831 [Lentinula raphanica]|nr:hypothetical protein EV361DRAFT_1035831 [Lentinula raphanica]
MCTPAISKQAAQLVIDALFKLGSPVAGRDLYEQAHKDDIKASAKGGITGNAAGNYQQARKQSWLQLGEEERRAWEKRALEEAQDIDKNQELLSSIINFLFMSMAKSGRLGEMEFMTLLTMRTTKGLLHATATLGGTSGKDFKEAFDDWEEHYLNPFQEWAEGVLPNSPEAVPAIGQDESGYPVFPDIDPLEAQPKDLQVVVKTFLDLLYSAYSMGRGDTCSDLQVGEQYGEPLPWEELDRKPENFYDVVKYQLPVPLKDPLAMGLTIFSLVTALKELDSPFRFRRYVTPQLRPEETGGETGQSSLADTATPIPPATTTSSLAPSAATATPMSSATATLTATPTFPTPTPSPAMGRAALPTCAASSTTTTTTPPAPTPASSPAPPDSLASTSTSISSAPTSAFTVNPATLPAPLAATAASTTSASSAPTSAFAISPAAVPAPSAVTATSTPPVSVPAPAIGLTAPPDSLAYTTM